MHSISKPFCFFLCFLFEICVDRDLKMSNVYNAVAVRSREEVLFHLYLRGPIMSDFFLFTPKLLLDV